MSKDDRTEIEKEIAEQLCQAHVFARKVIVGSSPGKPDQIDNAQKALACITRATMLRQMVEYLGG